MIDQPNDLDLMQDLFVASRALLLKLRIRLRYEAYQNAITYKICSVIASMAIETTISCAGMI